MTEISNAAKAERLSERRARMLPVFAVLFLGQQASYLDGASFGDKPVDHVRIAAWLAMSIVQLAMLITGGGWLYPRSVRQLANDETTRAHRDQAFRAGFLASMTSCIIIYFVALFRPIGGTQAIHLVMTAGLAVALLWLGFLERRANRGV